MEEIKKQFENIYDEHADAIYRFCLYKTSDTKTAEDLTQETFIRLWNFMAEDKEIQTIKAFVYQIARNLITDYYRKKKPLSLDHMQTEGFEPSGTDHEQIENKVEISIVVKVIEKLDEKYRDVVYLKLVEEMELKEIAKTLKITINNATVRFHRGIKYLQLLLNNNEK